MKFIKVSILLVFMVIASSSINAQFKLAQWPELKAFHGVMSETFHPS